MFNVKEKREERKRERERERERERVRGRERVRERDNERAITDKSMEQTETNEVRKKRERKYKK